MIKTTANQKIILQHSMLCGIRSFTIGCYHHFESCCKVWQHDVGCKRASCDGPYRSNETFVTSTLYNPKKLMNMQWLLESHGERWLLQQGNNAIP